MGIHQLIKVDMMLAIDSNLGIGKDGHLPWHLPNEANHFTKMTSQSDDGKRPAIIMGRKTWDEVRPRLEHFKDQILVVISRTIVLQHSSPGVHVCRSYEEALSLLTSKPMLEKIHRIWNVGGSEISLLGMKHPSFRRLYLTRIKSKYECDTFFPQVDWDEFIRVNDPEVPQGIQEDDGVQWEVHVYEKAQKIEE